MRRLSLFNVMLGHDIPGTHIDGMVFEGGEPGGSVRLTLEVVQSGHEPLAVVYPGEGVEVVVGEHAEGSILGPDKNPAPELFTAR